MTSSIAIQTRNIVGVDYCGKNGGRGGGVTPVCADNEDPYRVLLYRL